MKDFYRNNRQLIIGAVIGILGIYLITSIVVQKKLSDLQVYLDDEINIQHEQVRELASVTGRGGANERTETFIKDCRPEERQRFDSLLASLDKGLSYSELVVLDDLFTKCGDVFSGRRASMVWQLELGVNSLDKLLTQRNMLTKKDKDKNQLPIDKWQNLLAKEIEIQELFSAQVVVQDKIIKALLSGQGAGSEAIQNLRLEAIQIQNKLTAATEEATLTRTDLNLP